jgi:hypothetical protein
MSFLNDLRREFPCLQAFRPGMKGEKFIRNL